MTAPQTPGTLYGTRLGLFLLLLSCFALLPATTVASSNAGEDSISQQKVAELIAQLGDTNYAIRESATQQLRMIADHAIDQLLDAADQSNDLETALRAQWILETVSLIGPDDPPEVADLLKNFSSRSLSQQISALSRLIRLEENAGIKPLARLIRTNRSASTSYLAALILLQEWRPADPYWPQLAAHIPDKLKISRRPAAVLMKSLVNFSQVADNSETTLDQKQDAFEDLEAALETFLELTPFNTQTFGNNSTTRGVNDLAREIVVRCHACAALQAGFPDRGVAVAKELFEFIPKNSDKHQLATADVLFWAAHCGLANLVNHLPESLQATIENQAITLYAAARCEQSNGNETLANEMAQRAFALCSDKTNEQMLAAVRLDHWGLVDWADREYRRVITAPTLSAQQIIPFSIQWAELLNDFDRCEEAAAILQDVLTGSHGTIKNIRVMDSLGYSKEALAARQRFFLSRADKEKNKRKSERQALDKALDEYPEEIDTLIAYYHFPGLLAADKEHIVGLIQGALKKLQQRIDREPDEPNPYNEYAWLVANTEGDLLRATRYSKRSLNLDFDSASFLDTLAHCYAAAGNRNEAIRCQVVALRKDPGSNTIQKNLQKFLSMQK
ncbi:MAG: tetratricopeptide repeat protein [Pirellulales bacterium]